VTIDQQRTKQQTKRAHVISKKNARKNYQNYTKVELKINLLKYKYWSNGLEDLTVKIT